MNEQNTPEELERHYDEQLVAFCRMEEIAEDLIVDALEDASIRYSGVKSRVKTWESFNEKISRKKYDKPFAQCTDILGVRIVVYLESEIELVGQLLRELFAVDEAGSIDKTLPESANKFGYKSLHLICRFGKMRKNLPEYRRIFDLPFEIQVRTALQDTWAEIEHAYNYKSEAALPRDLERKLFAAAAILENVDSTLAEVSERANDYFRSVSEGKGTETDDPLTKIGVLALIEKRAREAGVKENFKEIDKFASNLNILKELGSFKIETLGQVEELLASIEDEVYREYANSIDRLAPIQFLRTAMINSDPERFLNAVDSTTLSGLRKSRVEKLQVKFPDIDFEKLLKMRGILKK